MYVFHEPLGQIPHRALTRSVPMLRRIVQKVGQRRGRKESVWSDIFALNAEAQRAAFSSIIAISPTPPMRCHSPIWLLKWCSQT